MLSVLIADDEIFVRSLIRETLSIIPDLSLVEAVDGAAALEQAHLHPPKLIILDIMMPKMSGLEVCRALKADPELSAIPVIIITASHDPVHRYGARDVGAVGLVQKPFEEVEFLGMVLQALQSRVA